MAQAEKLLIFLASPGDVLTERRYVEEVVSDLNRTVAPDKGVFLQVVRWENDAFPGYGQDAQELINVQIAEMTRYSLFVGIMWNHFGTPTPRAVSGTVEEFERAVEALKKKGQPEIWFYFREHLSKFDADEQVEQQQKVLAFRAQVEANGLPWKYKNPSDFRDKFRNQMLLWLKERRRKRRRFLIPSVLVVILAIIFSVYMLSDKRKFVLVMDSYAPEVVYDDQTKKARETNAHVIERMLKPYQDEMRIERELVTENYSENYKSIIDKNPDLIIIHMSSFYGTTVEAKPERLFNFLRAMAKTKAKFLVYSRSIQSSQKEQRTAEIIREVPELEGRLELFTFGPGQPPSLLNSDVAADITHQVKKLLDLN